MTVIATDGRTMAGDGRTLNGWTITSETTVKVHRLADGRIVGATGNSAQIVAFRAWLEDDQAADPKLSDGFGALVLNTDGTIDFYDPALTPLRSPAPQVLGCGGDFALAAMDCGASPGRAVEAAIKRSMGCGGQITELTLLRPPPTLIESKDFDHPFLENMRSK